MFWVREPQAESGFSLTTTPVMVALEPSLAVSEPGKPFDSQ
jgi:hypothetical protein